MVEDGAFEGTERDGYETPDVCNGCIETHGGSSINPTVRH